MPKPNVTQRARLIGYVNGQVGGSVPILSNYLLPGLLNPGASIDSYGFQLNHALLAGASVIFAGNTVPPTMLPTRDVSGVHNTICPYVEVIAHLRSAGNVDLPGVLHFYMNEYPPLAAFVAAPTQFNLGDYAAAVWQEWEQWSPLTIPTPPPGFTGGGAGGIRYEYRRQLGRMPSNFLYCRLTNAGSVAATEFQVSLMLRSTPPSELL